MCAPHHFHELYMRAIERERERERKSVFYFTKFIIIVDNIERTTPGYSMHFSHSLPHPPLKRNEKLSDWLNRNGFSTISSKSFRRMKKKKKIKEIKKE